MSEFPEPSPGPRPPADRQERMMMLASVTSLFAAIGYLIGYAVAPFVSVGPLALGVLATATGYGFFNAFVIWRFLG